MTKFFVSNIAVIAEETAGLEDQEFLPLLPKMDHLGRHRAYLGQLVALVAALEALVAHRFAAVLLEECPELVPEAFAARYQAHPDLVACRRRDQIVPSLPLFY
jgi:hypothetical protein